MKRLNEHLGHEFKEGSTVEVEKQLIHYSNDNEQDILDTLLVKYFHNEKKFKFSARLDMITKNNIWELKCTSKITQEHQLQVVVYAWLWSILHKDSPKKIYILNIRTGEKQVLCSTIKNLTRIVVSLLKNKYEEAKELKDDEFIEISTNVVQKYC